MSKRTSLQRPNKASNLILWSWALKHYQELRQAISAQDVDAILVALGNLQVTIEQGVELNRPKQWGKAKERGTADEP